MMCDKAWHGSSGYNDDQRHSCKRDYDLPHCDIRINEYWCKFCHEEMTFKALVKHYHDSHPGVTDFYNPMSPDAHIEAAYGANLYQHL